MNQSFYWILWLREKILVEFQSKIGVDVDSDVNLLAWKIMYYSSNSEQSRNDIVWKTQEKRSQKYWKKACETLLFMNGLMTYLLLRSAAAQILIFLLSNCKHPTEKFTLIHFFTRVVSHHHTAKKNGDNGTECCNQFQILFTCLNYTLHTNVPLSYPCRAHSRHTLWKRSLLVHSCVCYTR